MGLVAEIQSSSHAIVDCVRTAAVWISFIDHDFDSTERTAILGRLPDQTGGMTLARIEQYVGQAFQSGDLRELTAVFGYIQRNLAPASREPFLRLVIDIVVADGRVSIGERHALMLLADVVGLGDALAGMFEEAAQIAFTLPPADLSDPAYWENLESEARRKRQREQASGDAGERGSGAPPPGARSPAVVEALAILGLVGNPGLDEIKAAYRRLARVHHPDRYAGLDQDAIEQATRAFQRIQGAYERLSRSAAHA